MPVNDKTTPSLSPEAAKERTTNRVIEKIEYIRRMLEARKKSKWSGLPDDIQRAIAQRESNQYEGLPRSISSFCKLSSLDGSDSLDVIARPTLNSRDDLLQLVKELVSDVKDATRNNNEAQVSIVRKERDEAYRQISTLAGENHSLHLQLEEMWRDAQARDAEIRRLNKALQGQQSVSSKSKVTSLLR